MGPILLVLSCWIQSPVAEVPRVCLGNGFKVGEVTSTSAIVWMRVTVDDSPAPFEGIPGGFAGTEGETRVSYRLESEENWTLGSWQGVTADADYCRQESLRNLQPGALYRLRISARPLGDSSGENAVVAEGQFRTAPAVSDSKPVSFTVVTGQEYHRRDDEVNGHKIYQTMQEDLPDFFVHTGDIIYYDKKDPHVTSLALARFKWNRVYGLPFQKSFHQRVSSYFIKDDHDTWRNDCWPSMKSKSMGTFSFEDGLDLFKEQVPMGDLTYRTRRWGKHLQIWMMEGRDFRSPNNQPDGPEKTIWGAEQWEWLQESFSASDATFRVLISPTPIVGPDRGNKNDNHANRGFTTEGNRVRQFLASAKNALVICGDRHWQYISASAENGLLEFSCGPTSDKHAGGFNQKQRTEEHLYLRVKGGFLRGDVLVDQGRPLMRFRHFDPEGQVHSDTVVRQGEDGLVIDF